MTRMTGVIFSDLNLASSFMSLDWVQRALEQSLGFAPFPATLNVRPKALEDMESWRRVQSASAGLVLAPAEEGSCRARLYRVKIIGKAGAGEEEITAAILVPEVKDYPSDKIEIIAPVRLKDHLGVGDGDAIRLEFVN
jgi:riboflavin kinase, archaea type